MEGGEQPRPTTPKEQQNEEPDSPETDTARQLEPRIYVASLSDYNAGRLHGIWLDAAQDPEDLQLRINNMLAQSKEPHAEEWAIHDFEDFNGLHLGEWENLDHVSKVAKGIKAHGEAYAHWATLVSEDEGLDQFEDHYLGRFADVTQYAEDVLADLGLEQVLDERVPENLRPYVKLDAEAFGRDLQLGGDITVVDSEGGGVYVYSNR